jgi:hypothetical protein
VSSSLTKTIARIDRLVQSRCRASALESEDASEVYARTIVGLAAKLTEWADDPDRLLKYASGIVKNVIADVIRELEKQRLSSPLDDGGEHDARLHGGDGFECVIVSDPNAPDEDALISAIDANRTIEAAGGIEKLRTTRVRTVERDRKRRQRCAAAGKVAA